MRTVLVLNNCSGMLSAGGAVTVDDVAAAFQERGHSPEVRAVEPGQVQGAVEAAVAASFDAIFVGGGDGTVSTAARCMVDTPVALCVLPLGTLNHFAKDIGVPTDWKAAVDALSGGRMTRVDVAEVNGRLFINNCSLGAYPAAVLRREASRRRGRGKWLAMFLAILAEFWRLRRIRFELEADDRTLSLRTPFVVISNNRYAGHVLAQQLRPRLDEGRLWIYTTRAARHFQVLRMVWHSLVRSLDQADALETCATEHAVIRSRHPRLPVALDGEVVDLRLPLELRIRPRALHVIVPLLS